MNSQDDDDENEFTTLIHADDSTRIPVPNFTTSQVNNCDSDGTAMLAKAPQLIAASNISNGEENKMGAFIQDDEANNITSTERLINGDQHVETNLVANSDGGSLPVLHENPNVNTIGPSLMMMGAIAEDEEHHEDEPASHEHHHHHFPSLRFAKDKAKKAVDDARRRMATARLQKQSELFISEMHLAPGDASVVSITQPTINSTSPTSAGATAPPPAPTLQEQVTKNNSLDQYLVENIRSRSSVRVSVDSDDSFTIFSEGELAEMAKGSFAVKQVAATEESDHRTASFIQFAIPEAAAAVTKKLDPPTAAMQDPPIGAIEEEPTSAVEESSKPTIQDDSKDSIANGQVDQEFVSPTRHKSKKWISSPKLGGKRNFGSPSTNKKKTWKDLLRGSPITNKKKAQDPEGTKDSDKVQTVAIDPQSPKPDQSAAPVKNHEDAAISPNPLSQSSRTEASTTASTSSESPQQEISPHSSGSQEKQQSGPKVLTSMQLRQESRTRQRAGPRPAVSGIQKNKIKPKEHKRGARVQRGNRRLASKSGENVAAGSGIRETARRTEDLGHVKPRRRRSLDTATMGALQDDTILVSPSRSHRQQLSSTLGENGEVETLQDEGILQTPTKSRRRRISLTTPTKNVEDGNKGPVSPGRRRSFDSATIGALQDNMIGNSPSGSRRRRISSTKASDNVALEANNKEATRGDKDNGPVRITPGRRRSFDGATIGALQNNTIGNSPSGSRRKRLSSTASPKVGMEANAREITPGENKDHVRITPGRRKSFDSSTIGVLQDKMIVDSPSKSRRKRLSSKASPKVESEALTKGDEDNGPVRVTPRRGKSFDAATIGAPKRTTIVDSPTRTRRKTAGPRRPVASHHRRSKQTPGDSERRGNKLSKSPARTSTGRRPDHAARAGRSRSVDKASEGLGRTTSTNKNNRPMRRVRKSHSPVPRQRRHQSDRIPPSHEGVQKEDARLHRRVGPWWSERHSERDRNGDTAAVKPTRRRGTSSRGCQQPQPGQASSAYAKESSTSLGDKGLPSSRRVPIRKSKEYKTPKVSVVVEDASDSESEADYNSAVQNQLPSPGQWMEPIDASIY